MAGYTAFTKNGAPLSSVHKKERLFLCILTNFEKLKTGGIFWGFARYL